MLSLRSKIILTGLASQVETFLGIAPNSDLWDRGMALAGRNLWGLGANLASLGQ